MSFGPSPPIDPQMRQLAEHLASAMLEKLIARVQQGDAPLGPEYLSPRQVSILTGISTKTLEGMRATRSGPQYYKVGGRRGRVRYKLKDVRAWVEAGGPVK
jgi:predicted DNA-binding transcriptional regulator AlpA